MSGGASPRQPTVEFMPLVATCVAHRLQLARILADPSMNAVLEYKQLHPLDKRLLAIFFAVQEYINAFSDTIGRR